MKRANITPLQNLEAMNLMQIIREVSSEVSPQNRIARFNECLAHPDFYFFISIMFHPQFHSPITKRNHFRKVGKSNALPERFKALIIGLFQGKFVGDAGADELEAIFSTLTLDFQMALNDAMNHVATCLGCSYNGEQDLRHAFHCFLIETGKIKA